MKLNNLFKWKNYQPEIILLTVRWYLKYSLSFRNLVEIMEERGLCISHTTIMRWVQTGLRRGEILALTWDKIDFNTRTITVSGSLIYHNKTAIVKQPKTASSVRKISFRKEFLPLLEKFYKIMCEVRNDLGENWTSKDFYVFCNHKKGVPLYPTTPGNWLRKFIKKHDLKPVRLHDFRHMHATWLILNGIPLKVVSERLGHSNIGTTSDIYGHVLPSADQAASESLNQVYSSRNIEQMIR